MKKLTDPMKKVLRIMAEGRVIERWKYLKTGWIYVPWTNPLEQPHRNTVYALRRHGLIERAKPRAFYNEHYALTEAGRRAAEELT